MNFAIFFPDLEALADRGLGVLDSGTTTTREIGSALGLSLEEAVGVYEAYSKQAKKRFEFEREFGNPDRSTFDWHVGIKRV